MGDHSDTDTALSIEELEGRDLEITIRDVGSGELLQTRQLKELTLVGRPMPKGFVIMVGPNQERVLVLDDEAIRFNKPDGSPFLEARADGRILVEGKEVAADEGEIYRRWCQWMDVFGVGIAVFREEQKERECSR